MGPLLRQEAGLTLTVQIGFVVGALLSAILNLADVVPSRRLFVSSAFGGAVVNMGLLVMTAGEDCRVGLCLWMG